MTVLSDFSMPNYIPYAFWLGTVVSLPRLKVLKFSAQLQQDELQSLREMLSLDMDLYNWAREHFKPDLVLYPSYKAFFCAYFFECLLMVFFCVAGCGGCCRLSLCCTHSCQYGWRLNLKADPKAA